MSKEFTEESLEAQVKAAFRQAHAELPEASPYLKTRVLAELRGKREAAKKLWIWKLAAVSTSLFSVLAVMAILMPRWQSNTYFAVTGQPFLVKVELKDLDRGTNFASIELPEGVYFYSEKFPEVRNERKLEFAFQSVKSTQLPFVIHSDSKGEKEISLTFFDKEKKIITHKTIRIHFDAGGNPA